MNTTHIKRTIKGFGLASAMAFGVLMFAGSDANAQFRDRDNDNYGNQGRYDNRVSGREIKAAYKRGFEIGLEQGYRDARNRRGNNGNWGNNGGYNNGVYNNGGYGNGGYNNGGFGNIRGSYQIQRAFQEGFQKGYSEGQKRARNNRRGSIWPF